MVRNPDEALDAENAVELADSDPHAIGDQRRPAKRPYRHVRCALVLDPDVLASAAISQTTPAG